MRKLLPYKGSGSDGGVGSDGAEESYFTVAPKGELEGDLDWRMPVFGAGKYVIAFDGAALLLLELWRRKKGKRLLPTVRIG